MTQIIIIGGGPAGMMAAISAGLAGARVTLIEKNETLGRKLLMTGHGRCNVTNNSSIDEHLNALSTRQRFLYSGLHQFNAQDMISFLKTHGLSLKEEDHHRLFPVTDRAQDVLSLLLAQLEKLHVKVLTSSTVQSLIMDENTCQGVILSNNQVITGDAVVIATGGMSVPSTGSTGDGYRLVKGHHTIIPVTPALVPLTCTLKDGSDVQTLQGLTMHQVGISLKDTKVRYQTTGDLLFAHFGISGPEIINISAHVTNDQILCIDCLPDKDEGVLKQLLVKTTNTQPQKLLRNTLTSWLPERLVTTVMQLSDIDANTKNHQLTRLQRQALIGNIKQFTLINLKKRGFKYAMITKGGIRLNEINPKTMASKKINHLYFAGEVMDLDAKTGGFNLQIAWTTGYVAGIHAAKSDK